MDTFKKLPLWLKWIVGVAICLILVGGATFGVWQWAHQQANFTLLKGATEPKPKSLDKITVMELFSFDSKRSEQYSQRKLFLDPELKGYVDYGYLDFYDLAQGGKSFDLAVAYMMATTPQDSMGVERAFEIRNYIFTEKANLQKEGNHQADYDAFFSKFAVVVADQPMNYGGMKFFSPILQKGAATLQSNFMGTYGVDLTKIAPPVLIVENALLVSGAEPEALKALLLKYKK